MPLTVFSRDFGKNFNSLYEWAGRGNLPPQKLVLKDDELEEIFEIYTEDTERAGTFLTDEFARNLLTLGKRYQSGTDFVAAAFEGRKFYMALNLSRDFMGLEFGNEPFSESNDILHTAMEDLLLPRVVVDSLTGDD